LLIQGFRDPARKVAAAMSVTTELTQVADGSAIQPFIVNLGSQRRKRIKALKRGHGRLMQDVAAAVEQVRATLGEAGHNRMLLPVVFIYKQKRKGSKNLLGFPFGF
jgi:hypothetical protein